MTQRLTREEFRGWAESQTQHYERLAGEPVTMSPERVLHIRLKNRVWSRLDRSGKRTLTARLWAPELR